MKRLIKQSNNILSNEHRQLLTACLMDGQQAVNAWEQWISQVDIDNLDYSTYRLLPQLYGNMVRLGVDHSAIARFKGVHRRTWWLNQLLVNQLNQLHHDLVSERVEMLYFKGVALMFGTYADAGLRPMRDIDLLVSKKSVYTVQSILLKQGWKQACNLEQRLLSYHAMPFYKMVNGHKFELDLHWHLLIDGEDTLTYEWLVDYKQEVEFQKTLFSTITPTLSLFTILIHGIRSSKARGSKLHWLVDAVLLLRLHSHEIDWEMMLKQARQLKLQRRLLLALSLVQFFEPIPQSAVRQLKDAKIGIRERFNHNLEVAWPQLPIVNLMQKYQRYSRRTDLSGTGFLEYLRNYLSLTNRRQIPKEAFKRYMDS